MSRFPLNPKSSRLSEDVPDPMVFLASKDVESEAQVEDLSESVTKPVTKPTKSVTEGTNPVTEGTNSVTEATNPVTEGTSASDDEMATDPTRFRTVDGVSETLTTYETKPTTSLFKEIQLEDLENVNTGSFTTEGLSVLLFHYFCSE